MLRLSKGRLDKEMENRETTNPQDLQVQGLLDRYLHSRSFGDELLQFEGQHLDENYLTAFTEGSLTEREAQPIVHHLIDCSFCRHVTKELVRLDLAFAGEDAQQTNTAENQPSRISEVMNNLLSRIFGTGDNAVFAHQQKEEDDSEKAEDSVDKDK